MLPISYFVTDMLNSTVNPGCSDFIIFDYDIDGRDNVFTELNNIVTSKCSYIMNEYTTVYWPQ